MTVKIITDSLSDIPSDVAEELGITIVPLIVIFGHESYLDRVTITTDEFYHRLTHDSVWPTTTQPTPATFAAIYDKIAEETDEILVVTISTKISGTYESALSAKNLAEKKCRIEVIDSRTVGMGLGLIVIAAAKLAQTGVQLDEISGWVRRAMPRSHFIVYLDTLKYLAKGGRIGKAKEILGSLLSIKQILTIKDGEMAPLTRFRSRGAAVDYLYKFTAGFANIEELAVEHTTLPDEADKLAARFADIFPGERIYRSTVSPVLGTHAGPGALAITILEAEQK